MKKFQLPYGVQDYLPQECYNKELVEKKLSEVFYKSGYERVETSALEYFDLFDGILPPSAINKMFKMTDSDGSLLVLRPDTTLQICRMAAGNLDTGEINRLYYCENSFEFLTDNSTARTREFAQVGVELLGNTGIDGDIEIILTAIEALKAAGLKDFLIDIGNLDYFGGIIEDCGFDASDAKEITDYINNKDVLGLEMFLTSKRTEAKFRDALIGLPTLFGKDSVLDRAEKLCSNKRSLKAVRDLKKTVAAVRECGLGDYISVDLGMLCGNYYSGLVIRGIAKDLGVSILDGGRYDGLCGKFGAPMQAVGFAIGTKRLLKALENQGALRETLPCDIAYVQLKNFCKEEYAYVNEMKKSGKRVQKTFFTEKEDLLSYCRKKSVRTAVIFDGKNYDEIKVKG